MTNTPYVLVNNCVTSAGLCWMICQLWQSGQLSWRWTIRPTLFRTADGRTCAMTRDAIDKGLPQAAGIYVIDGDNPDPEQLRDVEAVGNA